MIGRSPSCSSKDAGGERLIRALIIFVAASMFLASYGEPVFSSHFSRQAQTMQTAEIFALEGFDFFTPKVGYQGRPGIMALEAPIYQTLVFGISRGLDLSMEGVARFLSAFFAIVFCYLSTLVFARFGPDSTSRVRSVFFLALLSSPIIFGTAQWATIETMNVAFGMAALYSMMRFLEERNNTPIILYLITFFVSCSGSLLIKPTVIFALTPIFFYTFFKTQAVVTKKLLIVFSALAAATVAVFWLKHAQSVNESWSNPHSIVAGLTWYFFDKSSFQLENFLKIFARLLLYVAGPGLGVLVLGAIFLKKNSTSIQVKQKNVFLILLCILSMVLYLLVFINLNSRHNYYQISLVFPLYLAVFFLFEKVLHQNNIVFFIPVAVALNVLVAQGRLAKQDEAWWSAVKDLKARVPSGMQLKELPFATNISGASPAISYYLKRYIEPYSHRKMPAFYSKSEWVIVCGDDHYRSNDTRDECVKAALKSVPKCEKTKRQYRDLWICTSH